MEFPRVTGVPAITGDQMREVDRVMIEDLGIQLIQMMENAGRNLADLAIGRFAPGSVTVLAGRGGNGGGGLAAARHLGNRGVRVEAVLVSTDLAGVPRTQAAILRSMGLVVTDRDPAPSDLIIDAVIGYSLSGDPRGRAADLISWMNRAGLPVLALDTPSGVDVTTGTAASPAVTATATMTLAAPKTGLLGNGGANEHVGELYLADISVPPAVYRAFGIEFGNPFAAGPIVRLAGAAQQLNS